MPSAGGGDGETRRPPKRVLLRGGVERAIIDGARGADAVVTTSSKPSSPARVVPPLRGADARETSTRPAAARAIDRGARKVEVYRSVDAESKRPKGRGVNGAVGEGGAMGCLTCSVTWPLQPFGTEAQTALPRRLSTWSPRTPSTFSSTPTEGRSTTSADALPRFCSRRS